MSLFLQFLGWRGIVGIGVAAILSILLVIQKGETRHWEKQSNQYQRLYAQDQSAFETAVANYRAAAVKAQAENQAHVQQIEQQQQKVTGDVEATYRAQLAQLIADNRRLRDQAGTANPGIPGPANSSPLSPASGGPGGQTLPLPPSELLQGQECELQLNALIDWVVNQASIDPNKEPPR